MEDFNTYANSNTQDIDKNTYETVMRLASKYDGASEAELLKAIYLEAEKGRKNGTLTDADIDNFVKMLSPLLDDKKRKKLLAVAKSLKNK